MTVYRMTASLNSSVATSESSGPWSWSSPRRCCLGGGFSRAGILSHLSVQISSRWSSSDWSSVSDSRSPLPSGASSTSPCLPRSEAGGRGFAGDCSHSPHARSWLVRCGTGHGSTTTTTMAFRGTWPRSALPMDWRFASREIERDGLRCCETKRRRRP